MSDHDRYVTGNWGHEHPDNNPNTPYYHGPECTRCTRMGEGWDESLEEWLCEQCEVLAYETSIRERINALPGKCFSETEIEEMIEAGCARTDSDGVFTSFDVDMNDGRVGSFLFADMLSGDALFHAIAETQIKTQAQERAVSVKEGK